MASNNPAFRNNAFQGGQVATAQQGLSAEELVEMYNRPAAAPSQTDRMTVEDTVMKTGISFGVLLVAAVVGWAVPALAIPAAIVGFVLALVNIFKKEPSPALILTYAGAQGLFVGGISSFFEMRWPGIVSQATIATLAVVGVTLALFASGKVRASKRATKIFLIAMVGYALYSLVNVGLMMFGVTDSAFGLNSQVEIAGIPLGLVLGVFVVLLAAYSLVLDFDMIQQGVRNRAPRKYGWTGAFGIMVTVIWLYTELLRMFAIARN
ncbi:putative YccA/Bax inhibitor family protein [Labedella gwakjiensis]|uniref:Bax inhibitor-1/YccA family protein n=1 Tax=Labedella gwakjiensis TaxID=390269 RepID=A0A2P8GRT3_9MICO|nr:Bax inhibitor-1/YccA family protein [Labedella gwakjiensis]PSL36683.1 putative YccA/Bax inhibitor family protein [Labedella gwakjiensis]RUQ84204.1 Bax inhibitor-1/YccA family protein [Labedella gwakjiensis]